MSLVKIRVKRVITMPDDKKTRLDVGVHEIEKSVFNHWFIQGQIAIGGVTLVGKHTDELSVLPKSNAIKQLQPVTKPKEELQLVTKLNGNEEETKINLKKVERVKREKNVE